MSNSRRSVSPQTVADSNGNGHTAEDDRTVKGRKIKHPVSRLSSLVSSYIKAPIARIFQGPSTTTTSTPPFKPVPSTMKFPGHFSDVDKMIIEEQPLNNDFTSIKKKRLSIQAQPSTDSIPRSSTLNNSLGTYRTYYNSFQTSNEEVNNDLERRLSTAYSNGVVKDGVVNPSLNPIVEQEFSRDASPLGMLPRLDTPMSLQTVTSTTESVGDRTPVVREHEYAPLYQDDEGNLVRPPFINLDPRERYHLLQLKRSVQANELWQRRIQYMVDPNETVSSINPDTKKVETATQTHDVSYLNDSLVFKTKKRSRRITSYGSDDNRVKRAKTSNKLFSGEFFYDVKLDEAKQSKDIINDIPKSVNDSNKFSGYLGSVTKPTFMKEPNGINNKRLSIDEESTFNRYGNKNIKSTNQRFGLNESLLNNTKIDLKLDADYLEKSKKISNIIKLKDTESLNVDNQHNKINHTSNTGGDLKKKNEKSLGPSSGFHFKINNDDINSIIESRNENEELVEKAKQTQHEPFKLSGITSGNKKDNDPAKPLFAFGGSSDKDDKSSTEKPKFGFGKKTVDAPKDSFGTSVEKPSFGFALQSNDKSDEPNKVSTPLFSFGNKDNESSTKPASLLFGDKKSDVSKTSVFSIAPNSDKKDESQKPPLTLGVTTTDKKDQPKSTFSFGSKPVSNSETAKPLFSFGEKKDTISESSKPSFSFGEKKDDSGTITKVTEVPKFSFEDKSTSNSSTPIPSFSLSDDKSQDKKKESSPFTFGKSAPEKTESDSTTVVPKFSFSTPVLGKTNDEGVKSAPFTFGDTATTKAPTPSGSVFGGSNKRTMFGSETSNPGTAIGDKDDLNSLEPTKKRPAFSFGGEVSSKIGSATVSTPPSKPAFSFGASSINGSTTATSAVPVSVASSIPNANPHFKFAAGITPNSKPVINFGSATSQNPLTASVTSTNVNPIAAFGSNNSSNNSLSRSTTPIGNAGGGGGFTFGSSTSNINPASVFGGGNTNGGGTNAFGPATMPTFQFGNTGAGATTRGSTPDATVFGGNGSREPTPFSFGGGDTNNNNNNNMQSGGSSNNINGLSMPTAQFGTPSNGGNPFGGGNGMMMNNNGGMGVGTGIQSTPTPPLLTGRKIAQMRQRRR